MLEFIIVFLFVCFLKVLSKSEFIIEALRPIAGYSTGRAVISDDGLDASMPVLPKSRDKL